VDTIKVNFPNKNEAKLALVGTIQFVSSIQQAFKLLKEEGYVHVIVPQCKPLSPGEILGCTSPRLDPSQVSTIVYLADGRFHLESIMIHNPQIPAYQYNPYTKKFSTEKYDFPVMKEMRLNSIKKASEAKNVGIILGTLGRQGSPNVVKQIKQLLMRRKISYTVILLSEIFPAKLALFSEIDVWIQIACPRLSIDWGYAFDKPLLTPYEACVAFDSERDSSDDNVPSTTITTTTTTTTTNTTVTTTTITTTETFSAATDKISLWKTDYYPMDYYATKGGAWSVFHSN